MVSECEGISLALPSLVDVSTARVMDEYGKFSDAVGVDFRTWAQEEFGLPLAMENDARMAMIGEWMHGAGKDCDDLVMITLGTGIGTSVVLDGRVVRGKHGQAGCLGGHTAVRYDGRLCTCGNIGCAEAHASSSRLMEILNEEPSFLDSALSKLKNPDYKAVFELAEKGDACALVVRDKSLEVWSALAVTLVHSYDPERVIIGGGISKSSDVIVPYMQDFIDRHARTPWGQVEVFAASCGNDAALVAGEWLVENET
jgi:glucokinase